MTKLFARAFAPVHQEVEHDQRLSEKMGLLQQFIRPEHLDIPPRFQNKSSWLVCESPSLHSNVSLILDTFGPPS
jgi:hypothetical protein